MASPKCRWECPQQWSEWNEWLAADGCRTVTTWLRGAGVSDDLQDYYYFLACVGRKSESIVTQLGVHDTLCARHLRD